MPARVVDASVVAAWCFEENRADEALGVIRDSEIHAPILLAFELTNIARRKTIIGPDEPTAVSAALQTALDLQIQWETVDYQTVLKLALDTGLTTYDASYLYLSRWLEIPLVTFDERLARAATTN